MPVCTKCQVLTSTSKRCPYCRICYCSKACRSTDWSRHKSECKRGESLSPDSNSSNGAASNIPSGEIGELFFIFYRKKNYQISFETYSNISDFVLGNGGLAKPGTYKNIHCAGRPCVNCGKCRDWKFMGDLETWRWIQNYKKWNLDDNQRWVSLHPPDFRKRSGATCEYQFSSPHYFHYLNFYSRGELGGPLSHIPGPFFDPPPGCVCDSNREN
uniref:MYND Zn finger family proteins-like protein n=1 Tax=Adineta vaga TaxID=104782 RepID=B3G4K1_ADIVA|nr:MYND Zn finger family proteins-like protein [Adineta vaga]